MADWCKLVERYSICALTFDRDRLPAIAGIARFVASYDLAGEYLFGLWSKSLHQGLLWVVADNSPQEVFYGPNYDGHRGHHLDLGRDGKEAFYFNAVLLDLHLSSNSWTILRPLPC
jgi:hypothetical protein